MSTLDQGEGSDEPDTSTPTKGEGKGKSIKEKRTLDPDLILKQNETTPNGSKRKRKDWRAFANVNGGARRRSLRSDMVRLHAETEAGDARETGAELEGVDRVKCGDDLQISEGKVGQVKAKVSKESNECEVDLVTGKELTKIDETVYLGNGKLGGVDKKGGDDAVSRNTESDFPSGEEVEELIDTKEDTKEKEGTQLLDRTQPEETGDGGNGEEPEEMGKGGTGDEVTAHAVSEKSGNADIKRETGEVNASCENSKEGIEIETLNNKAGPTDIKGKGTAEAEKKKVGGKQFNGGKEVKKKGCITKKRIPVQVESVIVERRITRLSASKQKGNNKNGPKTEGAKIIEVNMEEETSSLDQTDTDGNGLLKNLKCKKNNKVISDKRKSLYMTDSDEEFNPSRKRTGEKKAKAERDRAASSGIRREPPSKRKKLKMDKEDSGEEFKVIRRTDKPNKREVEIEDSDSPSSLLETLSKKKKTQIKREDSDPDSDFSGSDQETPTMEKRQDGPPRSKKKTSKARNGKMIKKKKKRQGQPSGSKSKEAVKVESPSESDDKPRKIAKDMVSGIKKDKVVKVESLSDLDDKPRKVAKNIVSGMIKDLLKSHGWTVEMRPRAKRNYFDPVHVAPNGTTHWSITKAYYAFLHEMESAKAKGKQVADFNPIPEELLGLLKKTMCKKRSDANKKNRLQGKKKGKGNWLGVKTKKIKKKKKFKKKNKKEEEEVSSDSTEEADVGLGSASMKSNLGKGRKKKAGLTLLARGSHKEGEASGENDYVPYEWKRTVLSWMIDLGVVSENCKVKYISPKKPDPLAVGKISRDGIECDCCGKTFTVSDFGVHAEAENVSLFLSCLVVEESGVSLLQCLVQSWEKQCSIFEPKDFFLSAEADGVDKHDDTCGICGDGGDLVCCDECPSTFHLSCLGMEMPPSGDWRCPYCSCAFCTKLSSSPLFYCTQCSVRFHSACASEKNGVSVGQDDGISFCGESCKKLFEGLEAILGVNHKMEGGFSWRFVKRITEDESSWDPVHTQEVHAECNSKIAVAMTVMDECFLPIDDKRSGIDLLQNVVYSCKSNLARLNCRNFYTFLLERDDEIICVASVRVHGNKLAEMPFIGTRYMYRRQGMCRRLLDGIELALSSLKVEKLIIPAITELVDTWTNVFGFRPLEGPERQEIRSKSIVVFPGTGLLQKPMLGTSSDADCNISNKEKANEELPEPLKNEQLSNGDMSHEFVDASGADLKPDDCREGSSSYATACEEGDLAAPSKPDSDVVQSVESWGESGKPVSSTLRSGKLCDGPAELESDPVPALQPHEALAEPESGSVLMKSVTPGKTKVLHGAAEMGPPGCGENGGLNGCAENGVHHLTGAELGSTDAAVMASAAN